MFESNDNYLAFALVLICFGILPWVGLYHWCQ